ncbi:MAG TPA: hypothetical protein ENO23_00055 [Alphaproteobacteria bacterium]|nr:hypothetical protein [Alphaproteobacteria bacterium]
MKTILMSVLTSLTTSFIVIATGLYFGLPTLSESVADRVAKEVQEHLDGAGAVAGGSPADRLRKEPHPFSAALSRRIVPATDQRTEASRTVAATTAIASEPGLGVASPPARGAAPRRRPLELEQRRMRDGGVCMLLREPAEDGGAVVDAIPPGCQAQTY